MSILDDAVIFIAVIEQGGFSHAAKYLGISNGLVSRRIAQLELELGATLIKRTTRQLDLTPEGILFWEHAQRIQQEINSAVSSIQSAAKKPKGKIRISAAPYFGRHYLTPILSSFVNIYKDITIDLILDDQQVDPFKSHVDLMIRSEGILPNSKLSDCNLQMKLLFKDTIGLYASLEYVEKQGKPEQPSELSTHRIIHYANSKAMADSARWDYFCHGKKNFIDINPQLIVNDIGSALTAAISGFGIGKFNDLVVKEALEQGQLVSMLNEIDWGIYSLFALFPQQEVLPIRTRLLLDFIYDKTQSLGMKKVL